MSSTVTESDQKILYRLRLRLAHYLAEHGPTMWRGRDGGLWRAMGYPRADVLNRALNHAWFNRGNPWASGTITGGRLDPVRLTAAGRRAVQ